MSLFLLHSSFIMILIIIKKIDYTTSDTQKDISNTGLVHRCGLDADGNVYQKEGNSFVQESGKTLKHIDVSLSSYGNVQVCGVDNSGAGWSYVSLLFHSLHISSLPLSVCLSPPLPPPHSCSLLCFCSILFPIFGY